MEPDPHDPGLMHIYQVVREFPAFERRTRVYAVAERRLYRTLHSRNLRFPGGVCQGGYYQRIAVQYALISAALAAASFPAEGIPVYGHVVSVGLRVTSIAYACVATGNQMLAASANAEARQHNE